METWSIEPYDDSYVTNNGNGNYVFNPANFPEGQTAITFTITYTDGDISGSMEYVVKTTDCYVNPCSAKLTPPKVSPPKVEDFSSDGGDINAEWDDDTCWELITATTTNNATAATLTNPSIISVTANTSPTEVTSVVTYKFKNTVANVTGQSKVTITQKTNPCITATCDNAPTLSKNPTTKVSSAGGTVTISYSSLGECWRVDSKKIREGYEQYATLDDNNVVHVNTNASSTEDTSIMVDYVFVNEATNYPCPKEIEIIQEEGCNCENGVSYNVVKSSFTHEGGTAVIGNLTTCDRNKTSIEVKEDNNHIVTSGPSIGNKSSDGTYPVSISVGGNETRDTDYHVKYVVNFNGQQCKPDESEIPPYFDLIIEPKGCTCTCSQIHRTDTDKSYNYNTNAHTDVLFKELGVDSNFSCYDSLEVFKYSEDVGIEEIHYITGGTIEIDGVTYTKLEIRGSLYELTGGINPKRTMRFGIKVCGEDCTELNPFYVYQRCSCGMDNCRNEYPLEGSTVYEDHPLYCNGCDQDWNGDAICVEKLNLTKVVYYTRSFANEAAIEKDRATNSQKQTVYTGNVWLRNGTNKQSSGTLNPAYVGEENKLVVHESQGQNMFSIYTNYTSTDAGYPLGTSLDYSIEAPSIDLTEQVWEITYTTTSEVIIGGSEDGDCALDTFVVTMYKAPTGWKYNLDLRDRNNKARKKHCD